MHQATDDALLGASGGTSPPALPIKQRRSRSSSSSVQDLELKMGDLHLPEPQTPVSPFTEVFTPTYCNAVHCPIHHRYENHQVRFFSEETPPPIPKKSLTRTLSLPEERKPPYHDHARTCNYENPLYLIRPFHNTLQEEELQEEKHEGLSFHEVTFDTPNEHLESVFRSFMSHEHVFMGIQECYLQFLKNTLQNVESSIFLNEQEMKTAKTSQPNDFILCEQQWTERDGFYLVRCPKVPGRLFSAKVHRGDSASDCTMSMPHPNTEQGLVHFPQCTATDRTSTTQHAQTTSEPSHGDTCQHETVADLLEKGVSVTVVRDFPLGTLEDFVEEGHSLHSTLPEVYERRLCLLALQLVLGLQQLGHVKVNHRELKPQNVTLVWPSIVRKEADCNYYLGEMKKGSMNTNASTGIPMITVSEEHTDNERMKSEICQTLWEKWGTPRLVLKMRFEDEVLQEAKSQEFQLGTLLRYCLHLNDSCSSVWKVPQDTPYTPGLLWLVTQLASEKPGLLLAEVVGVLQALLWGPRQGLFQQNQIENSVLSNWLLLKRSLLVLKLAEKGFFQDQPGLDWEDYLCLQYLSLTDPETMRSTTERMGLHDFITSA